MSTDATFACLGDAITAVQVESHCCALNISFTVADILRLKTVRALTTRTRNQDTLAATVVANEAYLEYRPWPDSPMQQLSYFPSFALQVQL